MIYQTKPPREGHNDQSGRNPKSPSQAGTGRYDKIITSPPYAEAVTGQSGIDPAKMTRGQAEGNKPRDRSKEPAWDKSIFREGGFQYSNNKDNIGNLPYGEIDAVITSPPYEGALEASSRHTKGGIPSRDKKLGQTGSYADFDKAEIEAKVSSGFQSAEARKIIAGSARGYSASEENIGNLKSQSYLEAMLQVYQQCFSVLKNGGLLILVTKNFIRDKKEVRLDLDTIKLCEQAGFNFQERWYRELPAQSFWRIIYKQKYPDAPLLKYEDVIVFKKDNG